MQEIQTLIAICDRLETRSAHAEDLRHLSAELKRGIRKLAAQLAAEQADNTALRALRDSLQQQIMDMASEPWENVLYFEDFTSDDNAA